MISPDFSDPSSAEHFSTRVSCARQGPSQQIGGELGATEGTVKVHRGRVMAKMEAASVPDLVGMARKLGILPES